MLYKLLSRRDRSRFAAEVVSLGRAGPLGPRIAELGVPIIALDIRGPLSAVRGLFRLSARLRSTGVDLVQTWMYHADLIGGLGAFLAGRVPVVWGIRQSDFDATAKRTTRLIARLCAALSSRLPHAIIACSDQARRVHVDLGYDRRIEVIPNGFDLESFKPDPDAGVRLRTQLRAQPENMLVGLVARFDPQKGHDTFVRAAAIVASRRPGVRFVLCGQEITPENGVLAGWIASAGIAQLCHLLGPRNDIAALTAGLDVAVSSSTSEGFSNTVGEAMACGVPCVVTDVGDSAEIVGDTGRIVPPGDPDAMADAICELIDLGVEGRRGLGVSARRRIAERYELGQVVRRYEARYEEIVREGK